MAYDRYDRGGGHRDDDHYRGRSDERGTRGGGGDDRGFWDRARDEVQSWFGDDDSGQRRHEDDRMSHPDSSRGGERPAPGRDPRHEYGGNHDRDRSAVFGGGQSTSYGRGREGGDYRNQYGRGGGESGGFGGGDYTRQDRSSWGSTNHREDDDRGGRGYPSGYGQRGGGSYSPSPQSRGWEDQHRGGQDRQQPGRGSFSHDDDRNDFSRGQGRQSQGGDQYRPMTGDYGRGGSGGSPDQEERFRTGMGGQDFARSQYGRQEFSQDQSNDRMSGGQRYGGGHDNDRSQNRGGFVGAAAGAAASLLGRGGNDRNQGRGGNSPHDEHYSSWRQRQIDELDNDYHAYRQEHQSRFENEFSGFRQQRQTKRQMLQAIRPHTEVVDQNGQHIGTVDKVHGDTIILTRNDPEAGGVHRSFSCSLLERVEGDKVYLSGTKETIRGQLHEERDEGRGSGGGILGGLFGGRKDDDRREEGSRPTSPAPATGQQGQSGGDGPHILDRSFSGTYDDDNKRS